MCILRKKVDRQDMLAVWKTQPPVHIMFPRQADLRILPVSGHQPVAAVAVLLGVLLGMAAVGERLQGQDLHNRQEQRLVRQPEQLQV